MAGDCHRVLPSKFLSPSKWRKDPFRVFYPSTGRKMHNAFALTRPIFFRGRNCIKLRKRKGRNGGPFLKTRRWELISESARWDVVWKFLDYKWLKKCIQVETFEVINPKFIPWINHTHGYHFSIGKFCSSNSPPPSYKVELKTYLVTPDETRSTSF